MNITNPIEKHQRSTKVPYHIRFVRVLYTFTTRRRSADLSSVAFIREAFRVPNIEIEVE